jgi:putative membrane protein
MVAAGVAAFLRLLTLHVFIEGNAERVYLAALLQPFLCSAGAIFLFNGGSSSFYQMGAVLLVNAVGVEALLWVMGSWKEVEGVKLLSLFRAFILSWAEGVSRPLEEEITSLGEKRDLSVDTAIFRGEGGGNIGAFVVPYIHPGPFGNVGSSALPEVLVRSLGESLGCEVLVAHGVSTHRLDLTRSEYNSLITDKVLEFKPGHPPVTLASPMIWEERGGAKVSCQTFGETALLTISLSPLSYDDLPDVILEEIRGVASGLNIKAIVVDCHNCIDLVEGLDDYDETSVVEAARAAMERGISSGRGRFEAAVARRVPPEWGLDEGLGPMGFSVLATRVEGEGLYARVVLDGNNMVTGLRGRLIDALAGWGFAGAEVLTSDIHTVNGIGATRMGYFPLGERMEWDRIVDYVVEAAKEAVSNLRPAGVYVYRTVVPGLNVLGDKGLDTLRRILERGFRLFIRAGTIIGIACLIVTIAVPNILRALLVI